MFSQTARAALRTTATPSGVILPSGWRPGPDGMPSALIKVLIASGFRNLSCTTTSVPSGRVRRLSTFTVTMPNSGERASRTAEAASRSPERIFRVISPTAAGATLDTTDMTPAALISGEVIIL